MRKRSPFHAAKCSATARTSLLTFMLRAAFASGTCLKVDLNSATFAAARENTINSAETVDFAFDGDIHTKWVDYADGVESWVTVDVQEPYAVTTYAIVSGNDAVGRDPQSWVFSASNDGGMTWQILDTQTDAVFTAREQRRAFQMNYGYESFQLYRLNITDVANATAANGLIQMSELELWYGAECHDPCCGIDCGEHGLCDASTGECSCDDHYSGTYCEVADTQWNEFPGRLIMNNELVWYKTTTLEECQKRCALDWVNTNTPCVGVSFRSEDAYCFLYKDEDSDGVTLEAGDAYHSYLPFTADDPN